MLVTLEDLNRALSEDQFLPHFQPIVELRTGRISGFEVLARWEHPVQGPILPSNLIELAERNDLITELSCQVFTKAFCLVAGGPEELKLSVNLSPVQLSNPGLARFIEEMASHAGFPLSRLTIEITESALLSDLTRSQGLAHELKELGCRLSLDDFGTGYSSLAHLHALPFNELKIDRAFVSRMTHRRESRKIVAAIIGLGHSLGLDTVAEGIECEEQADMLLWLGSELGQGWHYGRPAPFDSIQSMVSAPMRPAAAGLPAPGEDWAVSSLEAFPTQRLAQLQAIYDGAPVGLCFLDCDLRYISVNQRLAEMNGTSVAAHLGKTVKEIIPEVFPNIEGLLKRALTGEAITGVEVERPMRNGEETRWLLNSYQPAFDEADEVIGISISVMDISENKRAKDDLQESEFMQRQLVELNRLEPWMMDSEGNNLQMSSKWVRAVPGSKGNIRNLGWLEALHVDDLTPAISKMKKALKTGERIDMEYRVQNTEGEWRWMRSRGLPRFGSNGEITRWYGSVEDIHEKKCADAEAQKTEITMRALLRAVPIAIIIDEGWKRSVVGVEDQSAALDVGAQALSVNGQLKQHPSGIDDHVFEHDTDLSPIKTGGPGKITEHLFLEPDISATKVSLPEVVQRKRKPSLKVGLQVVDDVEQARAERKRLVTMLEQFAQQRDLH